MSCAEDPYETNNIAATDTTDFSLMLTRLSAAKGKAMERCTPSTLQHRMIGFQAIMVVFWGPEFG
ncbi:unnamed protein product [Clavelina lepadiformis]|uniref:Uncharacterized protein n=1 Tax=Clavelina lepadiformis TaxID=159417 RepID=A0ABP0H3P3_CLALP